MAINKVTYRLALDLLKPGPQFKIYVSTGETAARQLIISLRRGSAVYEIAEGISAKFYAEKPDGTILYNDCTIDGNKIVYDVTTQTVAAEGEVRAQLQVFDTDGAVLYSPEFIINVASVVYDPDAAESTDEYNALVTLQTSVTEAESERVTAESSRVAAEEGRVSAESLRISAESGRANAETDRASAENARASAETSRASAESVRSAAESARASAESSRLSAENSRVSAETARESASAAAVSAAYNAATAANGAADAANAAADQVEELVAGTGIMMTEDYDPTNKVADVFDMDNMVDGTTNKVVTGEEKVAWNGKQDGLGFTPADISKMFYPDNQYGGIETTNLNTLSVSGFYTCYGTATGAPTSDSSWFVIHINSNVGTSYAYQIAKAYSQYALYYRIKSSDTWGVWSQLRASEVVITDAGGYFSSGPSVETVMQEIGSELDKLKPHVVNLWSYAPALGYLEFNEEIRCINPDLTAPPSCIIGDFGDPVTVLTFHPVIVYKSPGTTAPTITNESGQSLTWQGIDVLNNVFYPKAGRIYRLAFEYISFSITITVSASDESLCEVPTQTSITLSSASWSSSTYTISNAAITSATVSGDIKIAQSATADQYAAWGAAQPQVTAQSIGGLTLTARGDVPTIDIPVVLEVRA